MHARRFAVAALATGAAFTLVACLPTRDNPNDPTVKPVASLVVRVDGAVGTIGGRGRRWVLDGGASTSPKGAVVAWSWSIADHAAAAADDPSISWLAVGSAATISSVTGETGATFSQAFRDRLFAVNDFGPDGLQSTSRFVKLDVRDVAGRAASATALLLLENHAPVLSLGPDLRVSPGGKWWEIAPGADVLGAPPFPETLTLRVQDPDGDEDAIATAAAPARWHVDGTLALSYDLDRDGLVDDSFFTDPSHRTLTVAAPVTPSRNSFRVEVSDVGSLDAGAPADGDASVRVDVLTNAWLYDGPLTRFVRLDTSRWTATNLVGSTIPLAADATHALLAEQQGGQVNLRVVDQTLGDVQKLSAAPTDAIAYLTAASDGTGGWWVGQGPAGANASTLRHFKVSGATLVNDRTVTSVEGGAASEFSLGAIPLAPTQDGSGAVWAMGFADGSGPARLYRINLTGVAAVKMDAVPTGSNATIAIGDGAGGVWIGGVNGTTHLAHVRRIDANGGIVLDLDLPPGPLPFEFTYAMAFDTTRQVLWATKGNGNNLELTRIDASNPANVPPPVHDALGFGFGGMSDIFADTADGSVLLDAAGTSPVISRFQLGPDGASFQVADSIDVGDISIDGIVQVLGGSILMEVSDFGSNPRLVWLEGSANSPESSFSLPVDAAEASSLRFAVDPATGFLWIPRPEHGTVEVHAGDGSLVRNVIAAPSGRPDATLSLDPETRTAFVGWSANVNAAGSITAIAMDATNASVTLLPGLSLGEIADVEMAPGRSLCVSASDGTTADQRLFQWSPSAGTATPSFDTGFVGAPGSAFAAASTADGSCWFLARFFSSVFRQDGQGNTTSFSNPVNPVTTLSISPNAGAAVASWTGKVWTPDATADNIHPATDTTGWLVSFGPGTTGIQAANPKPVVKYAGSGSVDFLSSPTSLFADPFYRHVWIAYGDPTEAGTGVVLRLDQRNVEVDRKSGFLRPQLHSLH